MKNIWIVLFASIFTSSIYAQGDKVVMTVNKTPVTVSEFKNIYEKNNDTPSYAKEDIDEYLDLFKNFKIVVAEAKALKYDTIPRLKRELNGYRDQLSRPYLIDSEKTEELIKEAYERMKTEIHAKHILIRVNPDADPKDTLAAYNNIAKIRNEIVKNGKDFASMATQFSEDPSAKQNGGDLGYFTSLQMVYPFENAAYNTKEGDVSDIVRTRFGYHILKVGDKRAARGKMEAAHIMIAFSKNPTDEEKANAKKKIEEIAEKLKAGEDFYTLATQYSDDVTTKKKGGRLPFFGTGTTQRMVTKFEDKAFALKNNDDFSEPFETQYGYHIVKRINLEPLKSFEEMENQITSRVNKDSRSQLTKSSFIEKLKKEYNFEENRKMAYKIIPFIDSSYFQGKWTFDPNSEKLDKVVVSFAEIEYTQRDFVDYLIRLQRKQSVQPVKALIDNAFTEFGDNEIYVYEKSHLERKYPEFKNLMREYEDGVLLFEIKQDMVWNKAIKDTSGLEAFYNANKENYMWTKRYDLHTYDCNDKKIAKSVAKYIKKGESADSIVAWLNKDSQLSVKHTYDKVDVASEAVKDLSLNKGINGPIESNGKFFVYHVVDILEPTPKKIEEAKGLITSDYQKQLEKEWMEALRKKHKVTINEEVLYNIEK